MEERVGGIAAGERDFVLYQEDVGREQLVDLGSFLDQRFDRLRGWPLGMGLMASLLLVRTREGNSEFLKANAVQREFERRRGEKNIVLKARQMGLTTWAAARFFLKTISQPGTLTLEVAHTQEAAEDIFRIVHRFSDSLPKELREGALRTSRDNVRQIVFPEIDSTYSGRPECGAWIDGAESALLGAGSVAGRPGGDARGPAGVDGAGGGADSGVDAGRRGGMLLRGVAEGARNGDGAAFLSLVDGGAVPGGGSG